MWLDELPLVIADVERSPFPFSFTYDGQPCQEFLKTWTSKTQHVTLDADREKETLSWEDPQSRLRVTCEMIRLRDFPAVEWLMYFENAGNADTQDRGECECVRHRT